MAKTPTLKLKGADSFPTRHQAKIATTDQAIPYDESEEMVKRLSNNAQLWPFESILKYLDANGYDLSTLELSVSMKPVTEEKELSYFIYKPTHSCDYELWETERRFFADGSGHKDTHRKVRKVTVRSRGSSDEYEAEVMRKAQQMIADHLKDPNAPWCAYGRDTCYSKRPSLHCKPVPEPILQE